MSSATNFKIYDPVVSQLASLNPGKIISGIVSSDGPTTVKADLAEFGVNTEGQLTLKFTSGDNRVVYTHAYEIDAAPPTISGGVLGGNDTVGSTTPVVLGGTSQRLKGVTAVGGNYSVYNVTDNIYYSVILYILTSDTVKTAYINVHY